MARTKRNTDYLQQRACQISAEKQKIYHTGGYVRLSVKDRRRHDLDCMIGNQKKLVCEYIQNQQDMKFVDLYCDYGHPGTDFDRPAFEKLLNDVKSGRIDCIVVKDLSRFGRSYLEAGYYIEKIFPLLDVRFVAVEERFDTDSRKEGDGYVIPLKNMINELYSRDISKKVSTALAVRQRRGDFIGSWASYGYEKCADDPHRIQPDKDTAWVVQKIFQMRLLGMGCKDIADRLNEQGIDSPSHMRYLKGELINERYAHCKWQGQMIKKILSNLVYLGHMVQGRKRGTFYEGNRQKVLPESEWIVVKNTHEPIIDEKVFQAVQQMASGKGGVI